MKFFGIKVKRESHLHLSNWKLHFLGNEWVDPDDPTVIAENELLGAANSIDAAAKKLASLRPRRSIQVRCVSKPSVAEFFSGEGSTWMSSSLRYV